MNFKPTIWKTAISIITGVIIGIWFRSTFYKCVGSCDLSFHFIELEYLVPVFFITFGLIYIVWSLIQKKR